MLVIVSRSGPAGYSADCMHAKKIGIIHTTVATVAPLKELAAKLMPESPVINFVDDSVLPQLAESQGDLTTVEERVRQYARFAECAGAEVVLEACSSIGELVPKIKQDLSIPVVRIDEAMAEAAVSEASRIGVVATLATTLQPTVRLLKSKVDQAHKEITIQQALVSDAYEKLMKGDPSGHDDLLSATIEGLSRLVDVIVLAQASMARILPRLPEDVRVKCLTSPPFAMAQIKRAMEG